MAAARQAQEHNVRSPPATPERRVAPIFVFGQNRTPPGAAQGRAPGASPAAQGRATPPLATRGTPGAAAATAASAATGANATPVSIKAPKGFEKFTPEKGSWSPPAGDQAANPNNSMPAAGQAVRNRLNASKSGSEPLQKKPKKVKRVDDLGKRTPEPHHPRLNHGQNKGRRMKRRTKRNNDGKQLRYKLKDEDEKMRTDERTIV